MIFTNLKQVDTLVYCAFEVKDTEEQVIHATKYFTLAESLGAVESLISVPALMTHALYQRMSAQKKVLLMA